MNLFYVTEICSKVCFSKLIILALILRVKPYNLPFIELVETQTPVWNKNVDEKLYVQIFSLIFWLHYAQLIIEKKCASWLDTTGGTYIPTKDSCLCSEHNS